EAMSSGMGIHERCTNAARHGALSVKSGHVDVAWRAAGGRLRLSWRERDGPEARPPSRRGFGLRVIEASFRDQLHGTVELSFDPPGFACEIDVPVEGLARPRRDVSLGA